MMSSKTMWFRYLLEKTYITPYLTKKFYKKLTYKPKNRV